MVRARDRLAGWLGWPHPCSGGDFLRREAHASELVAVLKHIRNRGSRERSATWKQQENRRAP